MSELEYYLVLNSRLLPVFLGPCCEVFANLYIVRPSSKNSIGDSFTQPHVKNTHQMPLSGRARKNTDTKRCKTQQNLLRIQRQCHHQEEHDKTQPQISTFYKTQRHLHHIQRQCHRQEGPGQLRGCLLQWRPRCQAPEKFLLQLTCITSN